jgi:hypothetical protein
VMIRGCNRSQADGGRGVRMASPEFEEYST